jgi:hypothetical protein
MSNQILYILACYGVTLLIVQSKVMKPVREFFKNRVNFIYGLIHCMMCTGFWVGFLSTLFFDCSITYEIIGGDTSMIWFNIFDASLISGVIWLLYLVQLNLERHVKDEL